MTHNPSFTVCRNKIPEVDLANIFMDELKNYLLSPEQLQSYLKNANSAISKKGNLVESLRAELQRAKQEAEKTHRLYLDGHLTGAQFKEIYQPIDSRKQQLENELPRLEAELDLLKIDGLSSEQIIMEACDLHSRWPSMNQEERRKIVESLVRDIVIGRGEITLNLCYLPSFENMANRQRIL